MALAEKKDERTSDMILAEIERKLSTIDGISTSDAFALGGLVREYGTKTAGDAASQVIGPLLEGIMKPKKSDEPWKDSRGF